MKTLYVTDLDGTLLRSNERTSDFTNQTINKLVDMGMVFSYATARSFKTAHKVTAGMSAEFPVIVYNGTLIVDNLTGEILISHFFDDAEKKEILHDLISHDIYPIVYSLIDGNEKFSYVQERNTIEMQEFIATRKGDVRDNPVNNVDDLYKGDCFYINCIDSKEKLEPLYLKYKDKYPTFFGEDIYLHSQWLEILPHNVSKANAAMQLKDLLGCEKLVVFGDGTNDIDMFMAADEAYAVSNASEELKKLATDIIGSNNEDAVAKWLLNHII